LLLLVFVAQFSSKLLVMGYYYWNKDFIAKNYCENKAKPQLKCNGKCHLSKQLKKQDQTEQKQVPNLKDAGEWVLFFETVPVVNPIVKSSSILQTAYHFSVNDYTTTPIFHPPC